MKCAILLNSDDDLPIDLQGIENVTYLTPGELKIKLGRWIRNNILTCDIISLNEYLEEIAIQYVGIQ